MKQTLIYLVRKAWLISIPYKNKDIFKNIKNKYDVDVIIVSINNEPEKLNKEETEKKQELINMWFSFQKFINEKELIKFIKKIKWNVQVYTYKENTSIIAFRMKKALWQKITKNINLFAEKKLQRKSLLEYNKDITVNYKKIDNVENIDIKEILEIFDFPFIMKPSSWIASSWVYKINTVKELEDAISNIKKVILKNKKIIWLDLEEIIFEEYIDWKMYTIDYFVDENQNIHLTKLVRTFTLKDEYWIEDFWITKEILWKKVEKKIPSDQLNKFIESNVKACWIRNTFVHHEFKLTNNWQLKTIELNGRIGWHRPNMYQAAYKISPLEFLFNRKLKPKFKEYYMFIWLFPTKERNLIYGWLVNEFIERIKDLPSFLKIVLKKEMIGGKIWLTKNAYRFFWTIELVNKDYNQLNKDYKFIKDNLQDNIIYLKK